MTFSKLGTDGQLTKQVNQQTGKEEFVFTPTLNVHGKEIPVELPKSSRLQGTYLIGATGAGKSGLFENLVLQDIKQGTGVCVLDPHGDLINNIIARLSSEDINRVILLDASDTKHQGTDYYFGLNLYQCDNPADDDLAQ